MGHNCNFDKINLLARIRGTMWRLKRYAEDAEAGNHPLCKQLYEDMHNDLEKYSEKLEAAITGLAREGKFKFCKDC